MDTPTLPVGRFDQGREYLRAVETLGLRPSAFFWAYDRVTEEFVLVLVADAFDAVGPFELSKRLFKAYKAEATPRSIDPFVIRLHSPEHTVVRGMGKIIPFKGGFQPTLRGGSRGPEETTRAARVVTKVDGLEIDGDWVYRFERPLAQQKTTDVLRQWRHFEKNVDRLAA